MEPDSHRYGFDRLLELYSTDLEQLRALALAEREARYGRAIFFNRNFHIEPSNICIHRCKFCSYRRDNEEQSGAWSMSLEQIREYCLKKYSKGITEVHIVGSVHPERDLDYYISIISMVKGLLPKEVSIKAYSAVEIDDMSISSGLNSEQVLTRLKEAGLDALPGGGAEIFDNSIRMQICPDKASAERYLEIHRTAHKLGIPTNCTMLFGHIESREQRVAHMLKLRELQDGTGGFNAFIPLKYSCANNSLSEIGEVSQEEILRTIAISRLALDNIPHIKAYWPMLGKKTGILAMEYGADDMDGTIENSTKIYSMAGAEEQQPRLTVDELRELASAYGFHIKERDSFYRIIS
ncbi:MAG TPA: CofH family radical SAM protein [Bacteroidales bacterium]|nr:CofH family radical SAM protein [Bacteroidales bacterium]